MDLKNQTQKRTINFRGYSKDFTENEWFFGNLIDKGNGSFQILEKNPKIWDLSYDGITVIPESIGQFTGLHDKNGKEIYEGDILKHKTDGQFTIVWDNDFVGFAAKTEGSNAIDSIHSVYFRQCEIIGNINENQELLDKNLAD